MIAPVNRIIAHSCVDGPGNRSVLFFQGCNFDCSYCHNPETIRLCCSCGGCVPVCPRRALSFSDRKVIWDEALCRGCDQCIRACPHNASPRVAMMTPQTAMEHISRNMPFIRGITVSGGECSLYRDFVLELFRLAKEQGLSTLMDSNGSYDFSSDPELLRFCDGVMLDIKCFDEARHISLTGQSNRQVLDNAVFLAGYRKLPEVRTVIVPDILPNEQTVSRTAALLSPYLSRAGIRYKLIRFRPAGVRKVFRGFSSPSDDLMQSLYQTAIGNGFTDCVIL